MPGSTRGCGRMWAASSTLVSHSGALLALCSHRSLSFGSPVMAERGRKGTRERDKRETRERERRENETRDRRKRRERETRERDERERRESVFVSVCKYRFQMNSFLSSSPSPSSASHLVPSSSSHLVSNHLARLRFHTIAPYRTSCVYTILKKLYHHHHQINS